MGKVARLKKSLNRAREKIEELQEENESISRELQSTKQDLANRIHLINIMRSWRRDNFDDESYD